MSELETLQIRQFKLMNGDEIIGVVSCNNETNFIIDRPFKVEVNKYKHDAYQLVPWFDLSLSNTYTIAKAMVVAHAAVAYNIKEIYIKFALALDEVDDDDTPTLIPNNNETMH